MGSRSLWVITVCFLSLSGLLRSQVPTGVIESVATGAWSSGAAVWVRAYPPGGSSTPVAGDIVVVHAGTAVTLDTNSGIGNLAALLVHGDLKVADTIDYDLGVSRIEVGSESSVMAATFIVGSIGSPFQHLFRVTLTGNWLSDRYGGAPPLPENRSFYVFSGATLSLHGNGFSSGVPLRSWLRLANVSSFPYALAAGSTTLRLESPPGWPSGAHLAVASTDYDHMQAEELTVTSIAGASVGFTVFGTPVVPPTGLVHRHHSRIETGGVDERAEVALLSRNIVVQGELGAGAARRGGHLFVKKNNPGISAEPPPVLLLDWVEFTRMGWHGALGRYPIHIHQHGSAVGNYVTRCAIHHCFNRGISVHDTQNCAIISNVIYDTWGHAFYFEDGEETGIQLLGNLGFRTRRPDPAWAGVAALGAPWGLTGEKFFDASDVDVSTYWISNTDNVVERNVAAGSDAHGFWYDLRHLLTPPHVTLATKPVVFKENVAHSNGFHGFWQEQTRMFAFDPAAATPHAAIHEFVDFTAYKNRVAGVWTRAYGQSRWLRARLADNEIGFYVASEGLVYDFQRQYLNPGTSPLPTPLFHDYPLLQSPGLSVHYLEDCDIVGETSNVGNFSGSSAYEVSLGRSLPSPAHPQYILKGVELYDGPFLAVFTRFHNFRDHDYLGLSETVAGCGTLRPTTAIGVRGQHSIFAGNMWTVDSRNTVAFCSFTNVDHPVLFPQPINPLLHFAIANQGEQGSLVYDLDGSIDPAYPGVYYVNNTGLLRPDNGAQPVPLGSCWAEALRVPGPGAYYSGHPEGDLSYANLVIHLGIPHDKLLSPYSGQPISPDLPSQAKFTRVNQAPPPSHLPYELIARCVFLGTSPTFTVQPDGRAFPITLLTRGVGPSGVPYPVAEYEVEWGNPGTNPGSGVHVPSEDPRRMRLDFGATLAGRQVLLRLPYDGGVASGPSSVSFVVTAPDPLSPGPTVVTTSVADIPALLALPDGKGYFYDQTNRWLYLAPKTAASIGFGAGVIPIFGGRSMYIVVEG